MAEEGQRHALPTAAEGHKKPKVAGSITFRELKDAGPQIGEWPRPIAHYKGFASRLLLPGSADPPAKATLPNGLSVANERSLADRHAKMLLGTIKELGARTVTWDGDDLSPDSFTALIPRLCKEDPRVRITAFLHEKRREAFLKSWQPFVEDSGVSIEVIIVPPYSGDPSDHTRKFADLGLSALQATKATDTICFGGGAVLAAEYEHAKALEPAPQFAIVPVSRWMASTEGGGTNVSMEQSKLLGVEGVKHMGSDPS